MDGSRRIEPPQSPVLFGETPPAIHLKGKTDQFFDLEAILDETVKVRLAVDARRDAPVGDVQARIGQFAQRRSAVG